jgi:hypothetical protein
MKKLLKHKIRIFLISWLVSGLYLARIYYMLHIINVNVFGVYKSEWEAGFDQGGGDIFFIKLIMLLYILGTAMTILIALFTAVRILFLPIPTEKEKKEYENYFG